MQPEVHTHHLPTLDSSPRLKVIFCFRLRLPSLDIAAESKLTNSRSALSRMDSPSEPVSPKMDIKADPDSDSEPEVTYMKNLNRRVRVKKEEPDSQPNTGLNLMFDDFDNGDSESALSDYDSDISDIFDNEVQTHELSHGGIERRDGIDWFICGRKYTKLSLELRTF